MTETIDKRVVTILDSERTLLVEFDPLIVTLISGPSNIVAHRWVADGLNDLFDLLEEEGLSFRRVTGDECVALMADALHIAIRDYYSTF